MFIYCPDCNYDSGDSETMDALQAKVTSDGGEFQQTDTGIVCACPNGHTERIELD